MIKKSMAILAITTALSGCGQFTDMEMWAIVDKGNIIVDALHDFHEKNNKYPESLNELVPTYLNSIPSLGKINSEFYYMQIPEEHASEYYYGFKLAVFDNKGFVVLGAKSANLLVYYPSEKYPQRDFEKTHKLVGRWAYQTTSRNYGKPNAIIEE